MMDKFPMPTIPLTSVDELPGTLLSFTARLAAARRSLPCPPASAPRVLLPHCAIGEPLSSHATNVLSDINSCFSDLLDKAAKPEGRMMLQDYVGADAERVIQFWLGDDAVC